MCKRQQLFHFHSIKQQNILCPVGEIIQVNFLNNATQTTTQISRPAYVLQILMLIATSWINKADIRSLMCVSTGEFTIKSSWSPL